MDSKSQLDKPNQDRALLCPKFLEMLKNPMEEIINMGFDLRIYEGFRSPERQDWLYQSGRTRPGNIKTNKKANESAHNFGLAADLVVYVNNQPTWDDKKIPYKNFVEIYKKHGLTSAAPFEQVHVEHIAPFRSKELCDFVRHHGLKALWQRIFDQD